MSVILAVVASIVWMWGRASHWLITPELWPLVGVAVFGIGVLGVRIAIPSTLNLDAQGLTWRVAGWPTRRIRWAEIERFGVVPPRPPLIDPLIGYSYRPGLRPGAAMRASWTGYDATLSSGWDMEPAALVQTLEKYRSAAR